MMYIEEFVKVSNPSIGISSDHEYWMYNIAINTIDLEGQIQFCEKDSAEYDTITTKWVFEVLRYSTIHDKLPIISIYNKQDKEVRFILLGTDVFDGIRYDMLASIDSACNSNVRLLIPHVNETSYIVTEVERMLAISKAKSEFDTAHKLLTDFLKAFNSP